MDGMTNHAHRIDCVDTCQMPLRNRVVQDSLVTWCLPWSADCLRLVILFGKNTTVCYRRIGSCWSRVEVGTHDDYPRKRQGRDKKTLTVDQVLANLSEKRKRLAEFVALRKEDPYYRKFASNLISSRLPIVCNHRILGRFRFYVMDNPLRFDKM